MEIKLNRREFLKLSVFLPSAYYFKELIKRQNLQKSNSSRLNVLIILFDSFSAKNIPVHGYPRATTPNLNKLAERAIVYHQHYSGANFTSPGTASLLTGTSPWTHRALRGNSRVIDTLESNNLFNFFSQQDYFTIAYSHNPYADTLLRQFRKNIDTHVVRPSLFLEKNFFLDNLLVNDYDTAFLSKDQILSDTPTNSLLLSKIHASLERSKEEKFQERYGAQFPRGIPQVGKGVYFKLEDAIEWINSNIATTPQPFFGYFHLQPPHSPYRTRRDFANQFKKDGYTPIQKPKHVFSENYSNRDTNLLRRQYDEFILYVDHEFNRLYQSLKEAGILENTIVVFTSDHGEMFERGIVRHGKATLHDPVIRVPLLIFLPDQQERIDVHTRTSALDLMPTLLHLTENSTPSASEGTILPPFRPQEQSLDRSFYMVHADTTYAKKPIQVGTSMIIKQNYKLMKYFGYAKNPDGKPYYEMYDLENDPEELENIYSTKRSVAAELRNELETKLEEADAPFKK